MASIGVQQPTCPLRRPSCPPRSCDTFVVLPPGTEKQSIVFGKNSDRPEGEVQEVIYAAAADHAPEDNVRCTYIEIPQVAHTHAVILSKPAWLWGAEMGANEHGVVIGNEAVWTKMGGPRDADMKLLGMDLVRLGLERCKTAHEAVTVISGLLVEFGQGGPCEEAGYMTYHNSFLLADHREAWVLETAGHHWAAQRITSGCRNISNELSIRTNIDAISDNCKEFAVEKGWWKPDCGEFDFAAAYSDDCSDPAANTDTPGCRFTWGKHLLEEKSKEGSFNASDMMSILRHEESGICMTGSFLTTGSQVSVLSAPDAATRSVHWFTATPNPKISFFKPFVFCPEADIGEESASPNYGENDPVWQDPPFQSTVDREHPLWKSHARLREWTEKGDSRSDMLISQLRELEQHCTEDMQEAVAVGDERGDAKVAAIFQHMVSLERNFYK